MTLHVTIDRITLRGIAPAQAERVVGALRSELRRLIGEVPLERWSATNRSVEQIPPIRFAVDSLDSPRRLGTTAAQSIFRGVRP